MCPSNRFQSFSAARFIQLKSLILLLLLVCSFFTGCETSVKRFYVKAVNTEEMKRNAFENCGAHYNVLSYEDDTALIECLDEFLGCDFMSESRSSSSICNQLKGN